MLEPAPPQLTPDPHANAPGVMRDPRSIDVVVIGGGAAPPQALRSRLPSDAQVICADRGYTHALALGLTPSALIGDFDSLDPEQLANAQRAGITVESHPTEKDATDLELALDRASGAVKVSAVRPDGSGAAARLRITVVATPDVGERIDHLLSQLALLAAPKYAHAEVLAWFGRACVHIVQPARTVTFGGRVGELVTLLAIGGEANGVTTTGLTYPLSEEHLSPFSTRGVSNILATPSATVSVTGGCLAIVRPHALEDTQ